jgi:hypothetical protein
MYAELKHYPFTVITVALDKSSEDARPYIEAAQPSHPSLIDVDHRLADLYRIVNVPTVIWVDEQGRIVRPNDVAFGSDTFKDLHGLESAPHLDALRAWVKEGKLPFARAEVSKLQALPTPEEQLARAEFALGWYLHRTGRSEAAERHFVRAGEVAPHDFTIRRGALPIRGLDPMGPPFFEMYTAWAQAGRPYYVPLEMPERKAQS